MYSLHTAKTNLKENFLSERYLKDGWPEIIDTWFAFYRYLRCPFMHSYSLRKQSSAQKAL